MQEGLDIKWQFDYKDRSNYLMQNGVWLVRSVSVESCKMDHRGWIDALAIEMSQYG